MDEADDCSSMGHQDDGAREMEAGRDGLSDESPFPNFVAELRACKKEGKEAARKPGIVYLSRIPPMTGPQRIKKIFSQYGEVGRVFLQPEDKFSRKIRRKRGGSKAKKYTEGWIEFMDKKIAKNIALTFNNTPMGGKKRSRNYEELWNMKYLHRFQWAHLAERLAHERQVRQQRVRTEISQAKRETNFYMKSVELSASLEKCKRQKGREWIEKVRAYKQIVTQEEQEESKPRRSGKVTKNTLGKIFK